MRPCSKGSSNGREAVAALPSTTRNRASKSAGDDFHIERLTGLSPRTAHVNAAFTYSTTGFPSTNVTLAASKRRRSTLGSFL